MESIEIRNKIVQNEYKISKLRNRLRQLEDDEKKAQKLLNKIRDYREYFLNQVSKNISIVMSAQTEASVTGNYSILSNFATGMSELLTGSEEKKAEKSIEEAEFVSEQNHKKIVMEILDIEEEINIAYKYLENLHQQLHEAMIEEEII